MVLLIEERYENCLLAEIVGSLKVPDRRHPDGGNFEKPLQYFRSIGSVKF